VVPKQHQIPPVKGRRDPIPKTVPVSYKTKKQARNVSKKVSNSKVKTDKGCLLLLLALASTGWVIGYQITEMILRVV